MVSNPTFTLDKTEYAQNEPIVATFTGGPGNQQDWVGIYKKGRLREEGQLHRLMFTLTDKQQAQPLSIMVYLIKGNILQDSLLITDIQILLQEKAFM